LNKHSIFCSAAALTAFALLQAGILASAAAEETGQASDDQFRRILEKARIPNAGELEVQVREHNYPPGWKAPTHYHDGALFIYVLEGNFEVSTEAVGIKHYKSGEAMQMPGQTVMDARNASESEPLKLVIFQVGPPDGPFLVPVE
jgi:quercetin dioxygenase-like cupin family protein